MPAFQPVRGMRNIIGEEAKNFSYIVAKARETARLRLRGMITPMLEPLKLLSANRGKKSASACSFSKTSAIAKWRCAPEFTASIARLATTCSQERT